MKIGIWGSYNKGNFGDDLMAYMFSSHLIKLGHSCHFFNATPELCNECGIESISNIEDFVRSSDIVVLGGGGMLINNSIIRFALVSFAFEFELSFYYLYKALKKYKKQLVPISIGGDGNDYLNNPFKKLIFNKPICLGGTVRLFSDLNTVDQEIFAYLPDIVLNSGEFFGIQSSPNRLNSKRIVLNLKNSGRKLLEKITSDFGVEYDIITYRSHLTRFKNNYEISSSNTYTYDGIRNTINFLSNSQLIISSKLHIGVTGLSVNTPFISYLGPNKAKEFLRSVDLEGFIINDELKVLDFISQKKFDLSNSLDEAIRKSNNHFQKLDGFISTLD